MYSVSDAYKVAVADTNRKSKMRAVLTIGNTVINLDDRDIIKDSVYVTNQCTNGSEYEYGCVYSAECGITIKSAVDRYSLYDAEIKLYWSLWTGTKWEEIPLGVFYITEPNRINDKISIKALDGMSKLDIDITEEVQGTIPQLLAYIADKCGVELAQTEEELAGLVNSNYQLSVYSEYVDTYRDLLAYIGMLSASFATFDRFGKLKMVQFATSESVTLDKNQRYSGATFSDYTTSFVGIKARFIANENYAPYEVEDVGKGLILDMGDIPIMRGLPEAKYTVLENVFNVLKNVSYTPFELQTMGNPALDLGDYVKNIHVGKDGKTYASPITYYNWTYRGKQKLRAVGGNPRLSGVSNKQNKQLDSLEGIVETKNVVVKESRNARDITFSSTPATILTINYATSYSCRPIILVSVRITMDLDGVLVLQFYTDGALDYGKTYRKYLERGEHFVSLADAYNINGTERHTIMVKAHIEYFESDIRRKAAEIQTIDNFRLAIKRGGTFVVADNVVFPSYKEGEIDTTVAKAVIKKGEAIGLLYGQGIAGEGKWDGTINLIEYMSKLVFSNGLSLANISENINISQQVPAPVGFTESVGNISFGAGLAFTNTIDRMRIGEVIKHYIFNTDFADEFTYDKYITTNNDMFSLKTIYEYGSSSEPIDTGHVSSVKIDNEGIGVESVVVKRRAWW